MHYAKSAFIFNVYMDLYSKEYIAEQLFKRR